MTIFIYQEGTGKDYMRLFENKSKGIMNVIRCDEPNYLIWKWRPAGSTIKNSRENAIRKGSSLRVKDGEVAVFVYKQNEEVMQDYIVGPFDQKLETANLPILSSILSLLYSGDSPFQAEIYFINLAQIIQTNFAVPYFDVFDPRFADFGVPVSVRGTISFKIIDYKEFIMLHRLIDFDLNSFQNQIKNAIARYVKDIVANAPATHNIPLFQIETKTAQITDIVEYDISNRLREDFGVDVSGVDIGAIELDKSSEGYKQLLEVTKNLSSAKLFADTQDYIERTRLQREEDQYAIHKQTESKNLTAFQVEKTSEVGIAGANALGQMGENSAGNIDLGSASAGFNPASMMASMAVSGAVGQNIATTMNNIVSNNLSQSSMIPPTIPKEVYNIVENGQSTGPYDIPTLCQMAQCGQIDASTLLWKPGMSSWTVLSDIKDLSQVINSIPPEVK